MALTTIRPTNCWTKAEQSLAVLLSRCASVQSYLGVTNALEATKGNMYIDSIGYDPASPQDPDWISKFPNILLGSPGDEANVFTLRSIASGPGMGVVTSDGVIEVQFAKRIDLGHLSQQAEERLFKNAVGDILEEFAVQDGLDVQEVTIDSYGRNPPERWNTQGIIQAAIVQVPWGVPAQE